MVIRASGPAFLWIVASGFSLPRGLVSVYLVARLGALVHLPLLSGSRYVIDVASISRDVK